MKSININQSNFPRSSRLSKKGQRGVVLFVALIVLVAMSLAGVSMMRAVGTGTQVAGNLTLHHSSVQAPEAAFENALAQIVNRMNTGTTRQPEEGTSYSYLDIAQPIEQRSWANAQNLGTDPVTGNKVEVMIDRLCTLVAATLADCETTFVPTTNGNGNGQGTTNPSYEPYRHFRIIARITDPKGKVTFIEHKID